MSTSISTSTSTRPPRPPLSAQTAYAAQKDRLHNRLLQLERNIKHLAWDLKWPTSLSIARYEHSLKVPSIVITEPQPDPNVWHYTGAGNSGPWKRPDEERVRAMLEESESVRFGFPVSVCTTKEEEARNSANTESTFFSLLPAEIRIQIYQEVLKRPRVVEALFSSDGVFDTFVGRCTERRWSALFFVCRESREIAFEFGQELGYEKLTTRGRRYGPWNSDITLQSPHSLEFVPSRDTIFFRPLSPANTGLQVLARHVDGIDKIQHLALPLDILAIPLRHEWILELLKFTDLKTLTFCLGDRHQSWFGGGDVSLLDMEEWFRDGRERGVRVNKRMLLDISEVGRYIGGKMVESRIRGRAALGLGSNMMKWSDAGAGRWNGVNVRIVAWKKG